MKVKIKIKKEVEVKILKVIAGVRYWEDATVNGIEDTDGDRIPCRSGDIWCPEIDIDTGIIVNWTKGVTANIHYKVCDNGKYQLIDISGEVILEEDGYVPSIMCPEGNGYGDYIKMKVQENGYISNWNADLSDFLDED